MTYRLSIAERIALTSGFRTSSDIRVLTALASFAHFETGMNAHPSVETLQSRVPDLTTRTVQRCLVRLEVDGWIVGVHQHRRPTIYRICVERLATNPSMAKLVTRDAEVERQSVVQEQQFERQSVVQREEGLNDTLSDLNDSLSGLNDKVSFHPVFDLDLYPSAPAQNAPARADGLTAAENQKLSRRDAEAKVEEDDAAPTRAVTDPDVRADRRDHPDDADRGARGPGGDQAPTPGAGVPLCERSDSAGAESDHRSRARVVPHQPTLGLLVDVSTPAPRAPQWGQLADALRRGLERKSG